MRSLRRLVLDYQSERAPATASALLEALATDRAILAGLLQRWVGCTDEVEAEIVAALLAAATDLVPAALTEADLREALLDATRHRLAHWVTTQRAWPYALSDPPTLEEIEFALQRRISRDAHQLNARRLGRCASTAGSGDGNR